MKHKFHLEALAEYEEATSFYADRDPAVAERFIMAVENAIDRILESPLRCRVFDEDVHRCLTQIFPYGILYTIERSYVLIVAIMHCSREPGYWKRRL